MKTTKYRKSTAIFQYRMRKIRTGAYEMRRMLTVVSFCGIALTLMGLS